MIQRGIPIENEYNLRNNICQTASIISTFHNTKTVDTQTQRIKVFQNKKIHRHICLDINTIIFFIVSVLSCGVIIYGFINIPYEKGNKT